MSRSLVYTAPDEISSMDDPRKIIFLAGGITGCNNWQQDVIERLKHSIDSDKYCIANPRRDDFPINGGVVAAFDQIYWEFHALEECDIFSMYFAGSESDQPICMYELGRNVVRMKEKFPQSWKHRIIVSIEDGYKRKNDVNIQLCLLGVMAFNNATPDIHAQRIAIAASNNAFEVISPRLYPAYNAANEKE